MTRASDAPPRMGARELVTLGLLGAVLFVAKMAMAWLPNIEPVSLLILVYVSVLGWRALFPVYIYVAMEFAIWGFGLWSLSYLYIWAILAVLGRLLRRMESPWAWAVLSGAFGLCFGALCSPIFLAVGGWELALTKWVFGIPFDLLHCAGNFVLALVLYRPLCKLLSRLW